MYPLLDQTVGLDTAPLIYFMERHPDYLPVLWPFFQAVHLGAIRVVTSTLTLSEVLVHPLRQGDQALARQYTRILLTSAHVKTLPVSAGIASEAAHLRATYGYKTPDATQLATAASQHATSFVTNDEALLGAPGLQVVMLKHLVARH